MRRLIEGGVYLRPGTYKRKHGMSNKFIHRNIKSSWFCRYVSNNYNDNNVIMIIKKVVITRVIQMKRDCVLKKNLR